MVQQATTLDTLPPSDDISGARCDADGCSELATLAYRWDWGKTGVCCALHATLLQQTAVSLSRGVVVHPIAHAAPAPLGRDERIALTARAMVLEAELEAAASSHSQLHSKNSDLQIQLNAAIVKARECDAQARDAVAKWQIAEATSERLSSENGRLLAELERLRELETAVAERSTREAHERGLDGGDDPTTVDG